MTLCFEIPPEIEAALRDQLENVHAAAKEACLVEFYRQGRLTHHQLSLALALDPYSTDGILKRHGVKLDISDEELERQIEFLRGAH